MELSINSLHIKNFYLRKIKILTYLFLSPIVGVHINLASTSIQVCPS